MSAGTIDGELSPRAHYVGAPGWFLLELACRNLNDAFGGFGCYLVGSALHRRDHRDVDVRLILDDREFERLFPGVGCGNPQRCSLWSVMCSAISLWLAQQTALPVDFQIQQQTAANRAFPADGHKRCALGCFLEYGGGPSHD